MDITWPIFYRDSDGFMQMFSNLHEINYGLEENDVELEDHKGWDIEGNVVRYFFKDKKIQIEYPENREKDFNGLKEAVITYAKVGNPNKSLASRSENIEILFKEAEQSVEEYAKENRLTSKIGKFFEKFREKRNG